MTLVTTFENILLIGQPSAGIKTAGAAQCVEVTT